MELLPDKYSYQEINNLKALAQDVLMISLPMVLQNPAFENIGTTKLKAIIEDVLSIMMKVNLQDSLVYSCFVICIYLVCRRY